MAYTVEAGNRSGVVRDRRHDGPIVNAVRTTGIFCRPSSADLREVACKARMRRPLRLLARMGERSE
jgi:methylphosphotriester-DNA--protein-cysteine methyltransferase